MKYDLDELERLEKAATPGPWSVSGDQSEPYAITWPADDWMKEQVVGAWQGCGGVATGEDADLIVVLRNHARAIFRRLRKLEAVAEAAKAYVDKGQRDAQEVAQESDDFVKELLRVQWLAKRLEVAVRALDEE